ncbi:MAG: hypothetical protein HRT61_21200, partial [Ekhidna sp.]|nr:hypothetical protein [Ekhidna sp.]
GHSVHFDEYEYNVLQAEDWELAEVLGAKMQEFRAVADRFQVTEQLTGHYLQGTLSIDAAKPLIENEQGEILASTNSFGNGKAIWIPSMVGLGARKFDPIALGTYCAEVLGLTTAEVGDPKVLFQQLASEKYTYKLIINTSEELFPANMLGKKEEVLFKSRFNSATGNLDKDGMLVFRTKNSSFTCIVIPPN